VPEVSADGHTGFVVETVDEMVAAVDRIATIDASACRQWVEDNFTVSRMVDSYEALYDKVRQG
jgi:glycosyltransferase involved in cell wall biosynthesis